MQPLKIPKILGGPLMLYNTDAVPSYWYQVGLVSYGAKDCGTENFPGVYSKVAEFLEWIGDTIYD